MNYEQKYKEALERARNVYKDLVGTVDLAAMADLEEVFPELRENEDEKVRKSLIALVTWAKSYSASGVTRKDAETMLNWLEKQGEKVPVIEFNAKDWYVSKVDGKIYNAKLIEKSFTNLARKLEIEKAAFAATGIIEQEEWFIKGAEWADENPSYISSGKQSEQKPTDKVKAMSHSYITPNPEFFQWIYNRLVDVHNENPNMDYMCSLRERIKDMQRPTTWSEEDEKIRKELMDFFIKCSLGHAVVNLQDDFTRWTTWLKSLRPQKQWKPSDEQINALDEVYKTHGANSACRRVLITLLNDLKKL